ncbi:MAG: ribonuclease III [Dehalococcoidales bacterium]|jgi:ribonuclease-3|nr:ribonuclease III [Dehalococcoidales bacterium]MDD4230387.1 ribonuclease III [Dehalococcoidales bacterium]MDD4465762.1 ribonuclease III [Dehalococcoidales bacterium]MDD5402092.1 ribonuclease III [Dehalococcoidales bacterium]
MADSSELEQALGYHFQNRELLREALVHSSLLNENHAPGIESNERLEYLGDAALGLIIAHELFVQMPEVDEGELTRLRSTLVCSATLGLLGNDINLGKYMFMGKGEEASGGRSKATNLARGLEAVLGAVYLDGGLGEARGVILRLYGKDLNNITSSQLCTDSKSRLQELAQARKLGAPSYNIVESRGPVHSPDFVAEVLLEDKVIATGRGKSKKTAEADAASHALQILYD